MDVTRRLVYGENDSVFVEQNNGFSIGRYVDESEITGRQLVTFDTWKQHTTRPGVYSSFDHFLRVVRDSEELQRRANLSNVDSDESDDSSESDESDDSDESDSDMPALIEPTFEEPVEMDVDEPGLMSVQIY